MINLNKKLLILIIFLIIFINLSVNIQAKSYIKDSLNRKVSIPEQIERVVAVGAGALRIVTYLELTDMIVGIEDFEKRSPGRPYLYAHPEILELPIIGPIHGGDAELIAANKPELIIWTYATVAEASILQKKTGIPVVVIVGGSPRTMDLPELKAGLLLCGEILNKKERAANIIKYIDDIIEDLRSRTEEVTGKEEKRVYIGGVGQRGSHGIISTEPAYPSFNFLQINNIASQISSTHVMVSKEKLLEWDPEIIFVDEFGLSLVQNNLKSPVYSTLTAIKENNIYGLLPYNFYSTNFGTLLANSYYIGKIIYPQKFADIDPCIKADEIYTKILGKPVYKKLECKYGGYKKIGTN